MADDSTITGAGESVLGAAAIALLRKAPDDWQPFPGDPELKRRLHALRLIERGFAQGIFGMYRRTEAGRAALAERGAGR